MTGFAWRSDQAVGHGGQLCDGSFAATQSRVCRLCWATLQKNLECGVGRSAQSEDGDFRWQNRVSSQVHEALLSEDHPKAQHTFQRACCGKSLISRSVSKCGSSGLNSPPGLAASSAAWGTTEGKPFQDANQPSKYTRLTGLKSTAMLGSLRLNSFPPLPRDMPPQPPPWRFAPPMMWEAWPPPAEGTGSRTQGKAVTGQVRPECDLLRSVHNKWRWQPVCLTEPETPPERRAATACAAAMTAFMGVCGRGVCDCSTDAGRYKLGLRVSRAGGGTPSR